jgi:hypothetical protein
MQAKDLHGMSVDELQQLHVRISRVLIDRLMDRSRELDELHASLPVIKKRRGGRTVGSRNTRRRNSQYLEPA